MNKKETKKINKNSNNTKATKPTKAEKATKVVKATKAAKTTKDTKDEQVSVFDNLYYPDNNIYSIIDELEIVKNDRYSYMGTLFYLSKVRYNTNPLELEINDVTVVDIDYENSQFIVELDTKNISILNYIDHKCRDLLDDLLFNCKIAGVIGNEWNFDTVVFQETIDENDNKLELNYDNQTFFNSNGNLFDPDTIVPGDKINILIELEFIICFITHRLAGNKYKTSRVDMVSKNLSRVPVHTKKFRLNFSTKPESDEDEEPNNFEPIQQVKKTRGRKAKVVEPEPVPEPEPELVSEPVKKGRGRKPKIVEPEPEPEPVQIQEVKKGRGRKPKIVDPEPEPEPVPVPVPVTEPVKKGRGRKPKLVEPEPNDKVMPQSGATISGNPKDFEPEPETVQIQEVKKGRGRKPKV